jgi:hypothetical protein
VAILILGEGTHVCSLSMVTCISLSVLPLMIGCRRIGALELYAGFITPLSEF